MNDVIILGTISPTSMIGGRVFSPMGVAPTVTAGTHGYGFGYMLIDEMLEDTE